jgi:hypothetical protein
VTMRRINEILGSILCFSVLAGAATGCNAYRLETPAGFAEVDSGDHGAHYKGSANVGLRIATFDNVDGGTLAFWSEDLVRKLGARGYALVGQAPVKSDNGLPGTRFDFTYDPPGPDNEARSYSAVLFVSDAHIIVMQLAGTPDATSRYSGKLDEIAAETKVRGCKPWTKICEGPQPAALATPTDPKTSTDTELAKEDAPQGG